jgi:glycosidase
MAQNRHSSFFLVSSLAAISLASLVGCGSPEDDTTPPGGPPDGSSFDAGGYEIGGDGYGYGDDTNRADAPVDTAPSCSDDLKRCPATFVYPVGTESSVELRGDYRDDGWTVGDKMTKVGTQWKVTVPVPWNKPVQYKFVIDGTTWVLDPGNPSKIKDASGIENSLAAPITCATFTCAEVPVPPVGVYDWRDAVIYFVFVDRFFNGDATNDGAAISGVPTQGAYQGGDWNGVTQKIDEGYFNDLGVNTLWITVPVMNADTVAGLGVGGDTHLYSAYHGYWPYDVEKPEPRFGTKAELKKLVDSAHTKKLRVLFDYAMVHVHKDSPTYAAHSGWFWPSTTGAGASCICGSAACPWDTAGDRCWFTDYLPHWNYTVKDARDYSVNNAVQWITDTGADGFRLDAIKHVDGSWLTQLRSQIQTNVVAKETPPQRFYMVGETYDFGNRDFIKSFVDPKTKLDGQFDFPLRLHLVQSILMRTQGMSDLASFMDGNDGYYGTDAIMSTFVGNHDLPRSIHIGDDTPLWSDPYSDGKDKSWSGAPGLPARRSPFERLANAFGVLFTNKGAPLVYYGDEIGLPGAGDPDNRRFMTWTTPNADQQFLKDRVKALLTIRAAHPALRRGKRTTINVDTDAWVYSMSTTGDTVYVAINRGDGDKSIGGLPSGALTELITGAAVTGPSYTVPARQTRVFVVK